MTFNSVTFAIFFAAFLPTYWVIPAARRNVFLLAGSYVFYGWWDWRFLGLLAFSSVADFLIGQAMSRADDEATRRGLLGASLGINLGILCVFKYFNFFADSLTSTLDSVGIDVSGPTFDILLPVGISFYTFQTISYTFDIYRGRIAPTTSLIDFATYVAFFPQLVAGPIERARELLPQITRKDRRFPQGDELADAMRLIIGGLFKKVVIADGVAPFVNEAFAEPGQTSAFSAVVGIVGFAIQIYGDFSGYSDIARGTARLLGIELVINFTEPYLSRNITEFWRRWHVSLSNWLRDYLYISLGGNRSGTLMTYRNLMLTMLLGGLWHGAGWNFVIWGGLHGIYLAAHRRFRSGNVPDREPTLRDLPAILTTLLFVSFAWVFFRAETFADAFDLLRGLMTLRGGSSALAGAVYVAFAAACIIALDLWQRRIEAARRDRLPLPLTLSSPAPAGALTGLALAAVIVFSGGAPEPFIYFQF